jgi:hypothetical protein
VYALLCQKPHSLRWNEYLGNFSWSTTDDAAISIYQERLQKENNYKALPSSLETFSAMILKLLKLGPCEQDFLLQKLT